MRFQRRPGDANQIKEKFQTMLDARASTSRLLHDASKFTYDSLTSPGWKERSMGENALRPSTASSAGEIMHETPDHLESPTSRSMRDHRALDRSMVKHDRHMQSLCTNNADLIDIIEEGQLFSEQSTLDHFITTLDSHRFVKRRAKRTLRVIEGGSGPLSPETPRTPSTAGMDYVPTDLFPHLRPGSPENSSFEVPFIPTPGTVASPRSASPPVRGSDTNILKVTWAVGAEDSPRPASPPPQRPRTLAMFTETSSFVPDCPQQVDYRALLAEQREEHAELSNAEERYSAMMQRFLQSQVESMKILEGVTSLTLVGFKHSAK